MKFENTRVYNFDGAIRGMRNPMESWDKSDSTSAWDILNEKETYLIGQNDMKLMQNLLKASMKEGNSHSKFMRQIMVCVDITAPLYWWKEADQYRIGVTTNSESTMHKLASTPITLVCFETDDYEPHLDVNYDYYDYESHNQLNVTVDLNEEVYNFISFLEGIRRKYLETKDKRYWKELIRLLPESWLQTRTVTLNYQVLRQMYFDRRNHKLNEWSGKNNPDKENFVKWVETLPYAKQLIMYEGEE